MKKHKHKIDYLNNKSCELLINVKILGKTDIADGRLGLIKIKTNSGNKEEYLYYPGTLIDKMPIDSYQNLFSYQTSNNILNVFSGISKSSNNPNKVIIPCDFNCSFVKNKIVIGDINILSVAGGGCNPTGNLFLNREGKPELFYYKVDGTSTENYIHPTFMILKDKVFPVEIKFTKDEFIRANYLIQRNWNERHLHLSSQFGLTKDVKPDSDGFIDSKYFLIASK